MRRLALGRRAVAAVEFAVSTPILLLFLAGSVDFGVTSYSRSALANAVASGAQYAVLTGPTVTAANVKTVVQNTSWLNGATATVTGPACYCLNGSTPTMASATCNSTCTDGTTAGTYVIINANYTYSGLIASFGYHTTFPMSESAVVRLQ